jgi:hypothetical protein
MKNSSDNIGNRTRDLPACSAVPQPTAPPRAPHTTGTRENKEPKTITQVRLDLQQARIRKQETDLHTDATSHPPPRLTPQLHSGRTKASHSSVHYTYGRLHTYWNLIGRSHYRPAVCVNHLAPEFYI